MRLLIVVPAQDRATGNLVTASRLQQGLTARGHAVLVCATDGTPAPLAETAAGFRPELVLLLHAWRSGRPWLEAGLALPYAVLLTGTDVNAGMADPQQGPVIDRVLKGAAAILSQNPLTVATLRRDQPDLGDRLGHLPPGVTLGRERFAWRDRLHPAPGDLVLFCPAGIRPVKGQLDLLAMCAPLLAAGRRLRLVFCGPILDRGYGERLLTELAGRPWAAYLGSVPPEAMADAMRQADVIVNNSASEGLPNALVEATVLGRPILARDIPGNAAVVTPGDNGLLYRDGGEFRTAVCRLQDEPALRARLARPAPGRFAATTEAAVLEQVCTQILAAHPSRQM
ncbi:MAG: glycosyltransferase family 4 protein [Deltaproteobacteria bacterium]|nr:MAG: glycosyltransferase family 4 protein [Deltaproteobacteria bacterium]